MTTDLEHLGKAVKAAQYRQHRALEAAFATIGTTVVQWDALRAISGAPGSSAHALAVATFQTDQSFGTLAQRLEARSLIARHIGDGRKIKHELTPSGVQKLAEANVIATRVRDALFATIDESDRRVLEQILARLLGA